MAGATAALDSVAETLRCRMSLSVGAFG